MAKFARRLQFSSSPQSVNSVGAMPVGNLPGWNQTFAQDFNAPAAVGQVGAVYGSNMRGYSGFNDTSGNGAYTPDQVLSVSNSALDFYIHTVGGVHMVACPIPMGYTNQVYGRYSLRMKSDPLAGYKVAFMLWPTSNTWGEGEVDFPEGALDGTMAINQHQTGANPGSNAYSIDTGAVLTNGWVVFTVEWTPGHIKYYVDGVLQLVGTTFIPTAGHRWTLQAETRLDSANPPADTVAGHLQIDWMVGYTSVNSYDYSTTALTDFTGTNGAAWPAPWTSVSGTSTIATNRGQQVTPAAQWSTASMRANTQFSDGTITATFRLTGTGVAQAIAFRYTTANNGYSLSATNDFGGKFVLNRISTGGVTALTTQVTSFTANTDYTMKVQVAGAVFSAKWWLATDVEPSSWAITATDYNFSSGDVFLTTQADTTGAKTGLWVDADIYVP